MLFGGFLNVDGLGIFNRGWGYMVFFTVYLLFVQWMGMVLFFGQHLGLVLGAGWLLTACSHNWAAWMGAQGHQQPPPGEEPRPTQSQHGRDVERTLEYPLDICEYPHINMHTGINFRTNGKWHAHLHHIDRATANTDDPGTDGLWRRR